jgi:hypothetical protein
MTKHWMWLNIEWLNLEWPNMEKRNVENDWEWLDVDCYLTYKISCTML